MSTAGGVCALVVSAPETGIFGLCDTLWKVIGDDLVVMFAEGVGFALPSGWTGCSSNGALQACACGCPFD